MEIKEVKKELGINNEDLAKIFDYASHVSYRNSSAKKKNENVVVEIYERTAKKIRFETLDQVSCILNDSLNHKGSLDDIDTETLSEPLKTIVKKLIAMYYEENRVIKEPVRISKKQPR